MRSVLGIALLLTVCALILPTACAPGGGAVVAETDEKQYQLAKTYESQGRLEEALEAYHRVIAARRDSPESHLEAGNIYLNELRDPIRSIYYFDQYLRLKPNSPQAPQVRQLIETAQKEFARRLPGRPYEGELDRVDLMELVKGLKEENEKLKRDLVAARGRLGQLEGMVGEAPRVRPPDFASPNLRPTSSTTQRAAAAPPASRRPEAPDPATAPRTHTVRSGDSLSSISREVYGTPSRWIDIYQANRDRLANENALKVGQELRIP